MKNKKFILYFLIVVLIFSTINIAMAVDRTPPSGMTPPPGMTPPSQPTGPGVKPTPPVDDGTKPLKERLQELYDDKDRYIQQKIQCKEMAAATNAPQGTCWDKLKPLMLGLLLKEITITEKRLIQLQDKNITISNLGDIKLKLAEYKKVFEDESSSKFAIKSAAKNLENLINQIEEEAMQGQVDKLIKQMDQLMIRADAITVRLERTLGELKAKGYDTTNLEASLNDYKTELAKTKDNIAQAKEKYGQMKTSAELAQLAKDVRTFINNAQSNLVKSFDKAKAMLPGINAGNKGGNNSGGDSDGNNGGNNPSGGNGSDRGELQ